MIISNLLGPDEIVNYSCDCLLYSRFTIHNILQFAYIRCSEENLHTPVEIDRTVSRYVVRS
jgi:hypothetical protein